MNVFIKELFKNFNPNQKGFKKKLLSFTAFLLISMVFWLLNALGEKYTEQIYYPLKYINLPLDKAESSPLPQQFRIKITTSGYKLLEYYLSANIKPIVIDFDKAKAVSKTEKCKYLLSKNLKEGFSKTFKKSEIQSIYPDTIKFKFYEILKKRVPVEALVAYSLSNGYVEMGEKFSEPDSINISGPELVIKNIDKVFTGSIDLGEINESAKRNVAIKAIEDVKFETYRTNITVPIEQATEMVIELPILVNNELDDQSIYLVPNTVQLSYKVGLSEYSKITQDQFRAVVNYNDSTQNDKVLKVVLSKQPEKAFEIVYRPNFVEFIKTNND